jgi:uncharacterized membrane protein YkoI
VKTAIGTGMLLAALATIPLAGQADDRSTSSPKSLVEIVVRLEKQGFAPTVEISLDDGVWEVEAYREDVPMELTIDARSGEIIAEHRDDADAKPPADSLPLSRILHALQKLGFKDVTEVSFERRSWEVEASREGQRRELRIDPKDATVISDRVDD